MAKVKVDAEGVAHLRVRDKRETDMFGRPVPDRVEVSVHHHDGYGVLVRGAHDVDTARRALRKVGYDPDEVAGWGYRPCMVDQTPSRWPFGLWVGGTPAVAFYF